METRPSPPAKDMITTIFDNYREATRSVHFPASSLADYEHVVAIAEDTLRQATVPSTDPGALPLKEQQIGVEFGAQFGHLNGGNLHDCSPDSLQTILAL